MASSYPELVLYHHPRTCSTVPLALAYELGIPIKVVPMTLGKDGREGADGKLSNAEYRKIHPKAYVPALVVNGQVITEGLAICTYLATIAGNNTLLGSFPFEKAKVYEWLAWEIGTVHGYGFSGLWRPLRFSDDENIYPAIQEKAQKTIFESYDAIEASLVDGSYAVSGTLTVVDLYLYIYYRWGSERQHWALEEKYPKYNALVNRVKALESIKEAVKFEQPPK